MPVGASVQVAVRSLGIGVALVAALPAVARAYLAPVSVSPNVQVDTRGPDPSVDFRSPVVVINPTNPKNVVVVSRNDQPDYFCHVNYSFDGGATWAASTGTGPTFPDPPIPAGKSGGTCWSPGVAFDASGNVYVVAQDRPSGGGSPQTVIVWKSTNGGMTFGAPVTIPASTTSGFSVQSDIAVDTNPSSPHFGRIYVSWHEFPNNQNIYVQLVHSDDGGSTWSAATNQKLPGLTGVTESLAELAVAPDGTVYDLFKGGSPFGSGGTNCAGIGFGTIPPGGTDCPIMILRSSDGGVSFDGNPVTVGVAHYADDAVGEEPSIVVTPSGTILVATTALPSPPAAGCTASLQAVVYRSTDRGQTWSAPQQLNDASCSSGDSHRDPRLSVAPNGRIDAAFYDNRFDPSHNRFDVEYTNSTDDGLTFGPNTRVSDTSFDGMFLFTPLAAGFQTRDYDTVTGLVSTNTGVIAAWGDTRNNPLNSSDVFSARIGLVAPQQVPANVSAPSISGSAVQGQALTEAHGSWSNSPTGYAYQWQRCDSAGAHCVAITGAGAPTYTLTAADVKSTIRVQETASNGAGAGAPASSSQTALVTAPSPPVVTGYKITNSAFVVAAARTPIFASAAAKTPKHKKGTTFRYALSEAATVRIVISQRVSGRLKKAKVCVAPTRRLRKAKKCTRIISKGRLTRTSHQGANAVAFSGRIGSRALKPGSYQATLIATDSALRTSRPQTIGFTVLAR